MNTEFGLNTVMNSVGTIESLVATLPRSSDHERLEVIEMLLVICWISEAGHHSVVAALQSSQFGTTNGFGLLVSMLDKLTVCSSLGFSMPSSARARSLAPSETSSSSATSAAQSDLADIELSFASSQVPEVVPPLARNTSVVQILNSKPRANIELLTRVMSFVNALINAEPALEARCALRQNFLNHSFVAVIDVCIASKT